MVSLLLLLISGNFGLFVVVVVVVEETVEGIGLNDGVDLEL